MKSKKLLLKRLSVIIILLVFVISLSALCGCKELTFNVLSFILKPRAGTIPDPEKFIKEHCGIELPSDASVEYTFGVNHSKGEYSYFLVCYYPETPKELLKYADDSEWTSLTEEKRSSEIEYMEKKLESVLKGGGSSLDDLEENYKPDWDSQFITCWKTLLDSPYWSRYEVYFPSTQRLLVWGEVG